MEFEYVVIWIVTNRGEIFHILCLLSKCGVENSLKNVEKCGIL